MEVLETVDGRPEVRKSMGFVKFNFQDIEINGLKCTDMYITYISVHTGGFGFSRL